MRRDENALPMRHIGRVENQFIWDIGALVLELTPRDIDGAAMLMVMLRDAMRGATPKALSIHAIAQSLRRPTETMRRAAQRLADKGFCERLERGFAPSVQLRTMPAIARLEAGIAARMSTLLDELTTAGMLSPEHGRNKPASALTAAATDIYLSIFELSEARIRLPVLLHVVGTITVMNVTALTRDPVLGLRYGHDDAVPPLTLRRPIGIREAADSIGFPYATVWRYVALAKEQGLLREVPGGYLLADRYMHDPETTRRLHIRLAYLRRVVADLARGAYDPSPPMHIANTPAHF